MLQPEMTYQPPIAESAADSSVQEHNKTEKEPMLFMRGGGALGAWYTICQHM